MHWNFGLDLFNVWAATCGAIFQQLNVTVGSFLATEIVRTLLWEHAERTGCWWQRASERYENGTLHKIGALNYPMAVLLFCVQCSWSLVITNAATWRKNKNWCSEQHYKPLSAVTVHCTVALQAIQTNIWFFFFTNVNIVAFYTLTPWSLVDVIPCKVTT